MNFKTAILVFFCVTFIGATASKAQPQTQETNTPDSTKPKKSESQVVQIKEEKTEKKIIVDVPTDKVVEAFGKAVISIITISRSKSVVDTCHQFFHFDNKRKDVCLEIELTELKNKKRKLIGVYKAFPELGCEIHNGITQGNYEYKIFMSPHKIQIAQSEVFLRCNQEVKISIEAPITTTPTSNQ